MKKGIALWMAIVLAMGSVSVDTFGAEVLPQTVEEVDFSGDIGDALPEDGELQDEASAKKGEAFFEEADAKETTETPAITTGAAILSVQKASGTSLSIQWEGVSYAARYELYRSTRENGTFEKIYSSEDGTVTSYTDTVQKGVLYTYKLETVTAEGESYFSATVSKMIPKSSKRMIKTISELSPYISGQYYYEADGKLNIVTRATDGNLRILTLNSKMKVKKTKTVKLGSYNSWGGFYHGTDGNFYVALGYSNTEENDNKTVIKVIQYNKKWKKKKTATILGSATNSFKGISTPFSFGTCRMDMQGDDLYLHTCRLMYKHSDGLRHQSNISFVIDTKTMEAKTSNDSYVSHSFNQYVKFKDGNLYLLDHGDAYPRAVQLAVTNSYGTDSKSRRSYSVFKIMGETGNNYTGCNVGGMEIGNGKVLTVGSAQPHGYPIKGVTGFGSYKYNVYLTVTDLETKKTEVKWLTKNNPKSTAKSVSVPKIVKLSDDRFAILYDVINGSKVTLNYVVVDENGNKKYSKKYKDMQLLSNNQPYLTQGKIVWTYYTNLYSIPAMYK